MDRLKLTFSGENQNSYETSAKVSKVLARFLYEDGYSFFYTKDAFAYIHERFDHPSIILKDSVSLYELTPQEAVFVDCGEIDVFIQDYVHLSIAQYKKALKMITLPIESFNLITSQIPNTKAPIVRFANHSRCSSTLVSSIFQEMPKTLVLSKPNALGKIATRIPTGGVSEKESRTLCVSIIKSFIKHANSRGSELICLVDWSICIFITDILCEEWPAMKHIYLYRQPVSFARSWEKLALLNNWYFDIDIFKIKCGIGQLKEFPIYEDKFVEKLSCFEKFSLLWIIYNAGYRKFEKKGCPIVSSKFEDLQKEPKKVMLQIFKYFEIPAEKLPDLDKVLRRDSQTGTNRMQRLAPITDAVKEKVNGMCRDFDMPLFWDTEFYFENNIGKIVR